MHGCKKCMGLTGILLLLLGIAFLLVDLGVWSFWGLKWWTAIFLLFGLKMLCASKCKECCEVPEKGKKK